MSGFDWEQLVHDTRGYLATVGEFDQDDPVPVDELVAQAEANGYREREVREALRETDAVEAVGDTGDLRVRLGDEGESAGGDGHPVSGENDGERGEKGEAATMTASPDDDNDDSVSYQAAVEALRDTLHWYHARVDETIDDHTDGGEHPDRPATAREYFTDVRGWDDETVDELLLGWAPPDHADQLVAHLHRRGHSREAILATGAVGESDSGGFYATFQGRYVLPYYDEVGDPAYAIARVTGGEGGGAKGYGGHPRDYQAGKYAKLRHTDERVPFEEPIYGLDTLDDGDHALIAEGIADAITAREAGYSVLSPVAREFKKEHFAPVVDALRAHDVQRVTFVADADTRLQDSEAEEPPESIGSAVARSLRPVEPGLAGGLRTAVGIRRREESIDTRVAVPPAPGATTSDLDEFVNEWRGDLDHLLLAAKPPEEYPEFEDADTGTAGGTDSGGASEDGAGESVDAEIGEAPDELPTCYQAALEARTEPGATKYASNHRLNLNVATLAIYAGYEDDELVEHFEQHPPGGDPDEFDESATRGALKGTRRKIEKDELAPPSESFLCEMGVLDEGCDCHIHTDDYRTDPRELLELDVVVEPAKALNAAAAVESDDLDAELPELERDDVDDVAIAVALAEGRIDSADEFPDDGGYTEAYYRARDHYGAPLPKYLDNTTLEQRDELVFAALERIEPEHILGATRSNITVEDPSGVALAKLDPTWEESESGERILAGYGRGFYCVEHEVSFTPLQLVALEHGLINAEDEYPRGEAFKQAYRLLREEYGAPVPKWRATILEHIAVLPPAVRVVDDEQSARASGLTLTEAREQTEALIRDGMGVRDRALLFTPLPGTGKTYGFIAAAADTPATYLTRRNELKAQAEAYAEEITEDDEDHPDAEVSCEHLPILAENILPDTVIQTGVAAIREHSRELLRDGEALLEHVEEELDDGEGDNESDHDGEGETGNGVDLSRATCPVGEGEAGDAWQVRIQVARALGHNPGEIHARDVALFGEPLPCQHSEHEHGDDKECELTRGWDRIRDPDREVDLLIGSPEHAYVDSATTYVSRDRDGNRVEKSRAVAIDEFPEEAYFQTYGERFMDHAVWLGEALVGVDSREDLLEADLTDDPWVDLWLDGDGGEYVAAADAIEALEAASNIAEASDQAAEILDEGHVEAIIGDSSATVSAMRDALETLATAAPEDGADLDTTVATLDKAAADLGDDADRAYVDGRDAAGDLYRLADELDEILSSLSQAFDMVQGGDEGVLATVSDRVDSLPVGGDLAGLLEAAVDAVQGEAPAGILDAAVRALRGGRDGCRELALWGDDGYAHPDAWALLAGAAADVDDGGVRELRTATFSFDLEGEGGVFKRLEKNDARIVADKNHHGAIVVNSPAFTDSGGTKCSVLGLDATGRRELWRLAIGRDVERRDIHETDAKRRRFLREVVNLRVIQTTDDPLPYHGTPDGKNFQEDLELVETVAEEYTGAGKGAVDDKGPAVISTKKVLTHLEGDLGDHAGATVNYENMKGSDALSDHQTAVLLGSQHYGDQVPEKWALLGGEEAGRGDTRGGDLDYGSDVANAYLRHMREDHCMQAALRAGRNDETAVVVAHTSALRDDLPVVDEGAVVSAHSQGTLAVVEAAAELRGQPFTARDVLKAIEGDKRAIGLRQVQNVLADLRDGGYLRTTTEPEPGRTGMYEFEEDPGRADVELPDMGEEVRKEQSEKSRMETYNTWNFALEGAEDDEGGVVPPSRPVIPAGETAETVADGVEPPG